MEPPIVLGTYGTWTLYPTEVYHRHCAKCGQPVEIIKHADVEPLTPDKAVLCTVCLANHYCN
jgi:hypothetical protein